MMNVKEVRMLVICKRPEKLEIFKGLMLDNATLGVLKYTRIIIYVFYYSIMYYM